MSMSIQRRHPHTGNLNSETSGDSENAFLHCVVAVRQEHSCARTRQTALLLRNNRAAGALCRRCVETFQEKEEKVKELQLSALIR